VLVEAGARATIIESHIGLGGGTYWAQPVTDIVLGEGAVLRHVKLQEEGVGAVHTGLVKVTIGARASFDGFTLSLGGRIGRSEVRAVFAGEEGTCLLNGVYLGRDRQHMDMTTDIDHAVPRCRSREVFKGVLDDAGRGVFLGRIVVRPGAQGTDGHQLSRVLLLSDAAESDTKPMLEIFADDVKCSHGAAVGALDADALHYLRARGIGETEARRLLIEAFAGEAIDLIAEEPVRDHIRARVAAWLDRAEGVAA
jgi:Fe-S cluster assembly protein SufD